MRLRFRWSMTFYLNSDSLIHAAYIENLLQSPACSNRVETRVIDMAVHLSPAPAPRGDQLMEREVGWRNNILAVLKPCISNNTTVSSVRCNPVLVYSPQALYESR